MKHRLSLLLLTLLLFPLVFSCGDGNSDAGSSDIGQVAFLSSRDGNHEIYLMSADGSNQQNISNNSSYDNAPAWKP